MNDEAMDKALIKVPEVTLFFWIVKIAATTLGETGGDAVTMSLNLDLLDKLHSHGGLALSRYTASAVLAAFIVGCILFMPKRAERRQPA